MSYEAPSPDPVKLQQYWEAWERGEETPGKTLANLKTSGMRAILEELASTGWQPKA
jgi:hypothetical protein